MSKAGANMALGVAIAAGLWAVLQSLRGNQVLAATAPAGGPVDPASLELLPLHFSPAGTGSSPGFFSPTHSGPVTVTPVSGPSVALPTSAPSIPPLGPPVPLGPSVFPAPVGQVHGAPLGPLPTSGPAAPVGQVQGAPLGGGLGFDFNALNPFGAPSVEPVPVPRPKPQGLISEDQDIMARTLYGEARSEGRAGIEAVASVIMNRVRSPRFPSTPKAVCLQNGTLKSGKVIYQFSAWNAGDPQRQIMERLDPASPNKLFQLCLDVAGEAVAGRLPDRVGGADHYWADYIQTPYWAQPSVSPSLVRTAKIGRHIFVKGVA